MDADVDAVVELLVRRRAMLAALREGPSTKRELETTLDVSRSTVDRAVRQLEGVDLVRREHGAIALTLPGRLVHDGLAEFVAGFEGVQRASTMLADLDADVSVPFALFPDAMVIEATKASPHLPVVALRQFLDDARTVESVATALHPDYVDAYRDIVVEQGTEAEIVVQTGVLDELLATYWQPVEEALDTGRVTFYETDAESVVSLKIAETDTEEVAILVYGDRGVEGFVRSDNRRAVEWAREEYERIREGAQLVAPTG
ncbi:MAG: helix-turn-helix transcriptional regulator [Halanaeroarchaeum sp.]